jgi:hypothetical protein
MARAHTGEVVVSRAIATSLPPDGEVSQQAVVQAAALLTAPRLVTIETYSRAYLYAVALPGGPAVLEFDLEFFAGPLMSIRASAALQSEAEELLDRIESKFAVLCPVTAAAGMAESDELPF